MAAAPNELDRLMGERVRHAQDYQTVLANRDDEVARLRRALGPASERWKILTAARDRANYEYEALAGQIGRPISRLAMPMSAFFAFAVGVAIGEAFANKFLFDVALQTSNIFSLLVSFIVALFMFIAAHFAGVLVRQTWSEHKRKFYPAHVLIASTIFAVLVCVLAILTVGRAETSAAVLTNGFDGLFSSLGGKVGSGGELLAVLGAALGDQNALLLATVNALGILAAFVLGYLAHDPDKHFDKAYERQQSTLRAVEKQDQRYKRKSNRTRERARLSSMTSMTGIRTRTPPLSRRRHRAGYRSMRATSWRCPSSTACCSACATTTTTTTTAPSARTSRPMILDRTRGNPMSNL